MAPLACLPYGQRTALPLSAGMLAARATRPYRAALLGHYCTYTIFQFLLRFWSRLFLYVLPTAFSVYYYLP